MELKSGTGNAPAGRIYITEDEYVKCRKVADAFTELYEMTDVMVANAGRFGFVRLQWFDEGEGFDSAEVFSDSAELFEELWRIWYEHEILTPVLGTPLAELDYDEIFERLPEEKKKELMEKRDYFVKKSGGISKSENKGGQTRECVQ